MSVSLTILLFYQLLVVICARNHARFRCIRTGLLGQGNGVKSGRIMPSEEVSLFRLC